MVIALIVAAGQGKRFGGNVPKQFFELGGVPIWLRSLQPFADSDSVKAIVLAVPRAQVLAIRKEAEKLGLKKPIKVVIGGQKRQDSVRIGLDAVIKLVQALGKSRGPAGKSVDPIILIHDGARPLATGELIRRVIKSAERYGAVVPGLTPRNTIKLVDPRNSLVEKTPARDKLREIQTPQGFRLSILVKGYKILKQGGLMVTDDAGLVELAGAPVRVIPGEPENIKITTQFDLWMAEAIAREKQKSRMSTLTDSG
jgi:2-C-methyl-D-erythritol 4-phosphate cytidylyltransferase